MNATAFEDLFRQLRGPLFGYFYSATSDAVAADDLVSETFLRAWRKWADYTPRYQSPVWIMCIARHLLIDHKRQRKAHGGARVTVSLDDAEEYFYGTWSDDVEAAIDAQAGLAAVWPRLTAHQQTALALALQGYTLHEAGKALGVPVSVYKLRLLRGRRAIERMHTISGLSR